jgi:hypothetical protein
VSDIIIGFLAISGALGWLAFIVFRVWPPTRRQEGLLDLTMPDNWLCTNDRCVHKGLVMSLCLDCPTCPACGHDMVTAPASYWALEKRVERLEGKP